MDFEHLKTFTGIKIHPEEAGHLDRSNMVVGRPTPRAGDVEGQGVQWIVVWCPWCGAANWSLVDPDVPAWFVCWSCGGTTKPRY